MALRLCIGVLALVVAAAAQSNSSCITTPQDRSCANYQLPVDIINDDTSALCGMMSDMIGCNLQSICAKDSAASKSAYCTPFAILKTLCLDMPGMGDYCQDYLNMCAPGSQVLQCNSSALPLGKTGAMHSLIVGICDDMPGMEGCTSECIGKSYSNCNLLSTYSDLCLQMPDMENCSLWDSICKLVPNWSICGSSPHTPPEMRMYFHTGIRDYILFKFAVPESTGMYVLAWILVALSAVLYEVLKWVHFKCDKKWKDMKKAGYVAVNDPAAEPDDFMLKVDVPRAALRALQFAISYLLMLIAMTFNVGLFLALVFGIFVGNLLVGRFLVSAGGDCCG